MAKLFIVLQLPNTKLRQELSNYGSGKENKANAKVLCISTFSTLQLSVAHVSFFNMWTHRTETDFQYLSLLYIYKKLLAPHLRESYSLCLA